jgi:hypothetical protein
MSSSCSFMQIFHHLLCSYVNRHCLNLLSHPILYNTLHCNGFNLPSQPLFLSCWQRFFYCLVYKKFLTSFDHSNYVRNFLAYVVYFGTHMGFVVLGNLNTTFTTTWVLPGLYNIVKSYSIKNSNHLDIFCKTYGLFIN